MTHTTGPWETPGTDGGARVISCRAHGRRKTIAHVYDTGKASAMDANAHLIAAAPSLLEACKSMLVVLDSLTTDEFSRGLDREAREQMEAAIALAEGVGK